MNALCLIIDRLHAGYLGAYGNTWVHTPAIDRLASESLVMDAALVDRPQLGSLYRSYWQGRHALQGPAVSDWSLPRALRQAGVTTALVSDEPFAADPWIAEQVSENLLVASPKTPSVADSAGGTHLAALVATATERLAAADEPTLVWMHAAALGHCWDAPLALSEQYADEDDPVPYAQATMPQLVLPASFDPDERVALSHAYAGQVSLLDTCLGVLLDFLREDPLGRETMLVLMSARGIALGEHRRVGAWDAALDGETVQIPWLVRMPDGRGAGTRSAALAQPADLAPTLLEWWNVAPPADSSLAQGRSLGPILRDESDTLRPCSLVAGEHGERGLRVPAWYMRRSPPCEGDEPALAERLFVKPDDRWEMNEVSTRCPPIVAALADVQSGYERALASGELDALAPLDEELTSQMR